ncbi:precorrin-6Y C5,15-methyltransferase (decarboxylating) /precorrin-3 methyltransferase [Pseudomonas delhiensis]|uniref:Cobalt-precorrin 5A hydrolase / precorrin-3B C17-methyltransferase n=1 Tax=Pseudomonas delhiensis TaxID=366289 RepID=A0A239M884_9PSED|nr:precorrin-3B C(17)-methyltransferase [Pseudomonas delhiensis]SDJ86992.1 precorrin-6Y C5,15-methyltransferase (decarboxylating) /precorrin-3 methyltransferase [Pseudomonas delhiensis]SNT38333.1 cobalt-precorrin 5A hydrolase / precorrin-3B C17-methyltransferase [Pseudomonas delhiensis]
MNASPAIVILGASALATARRVQALYPRARIHGLQGRVEGADEPYQDFGDTLRALYRAGTPIIALCAAGIVIRSLAPALQEKGAEPPVLAVAEDGSAVVPLLGGLAGVNRLAREIATALEVAPAITTSGELRFGACLLEPPQGYALADIEQGKRFVADLLGGESLRIEGDAPWLAAARLPLAEDARRRVRVTCEARPAQRDELLIHPRQVLAEVQAPVDDLAALVHKALAHAHLAPAALAALLAPRRHMADARLAEAARALGVPLRFVAGEPLPPVHGAHEGIHLRLAESPAQAAAIGRPRGRLSVIGLGPGAAEHMTPAVRRALDEAQDLLGYETYVKMAEPLRADQVRHCSDNREEMQRARHAFELAAGGRRVVVVSSGDPGVFAMAAAVIEALHESADAEWHNVELEVLPGVSAALAAAARAGAPLGHDFCLISLSDNLKPWEVIEKRLDHAGAADLAMAFYNPISRARPWQLGRALEIVRQHRAAETLVVLGRDIGRPAEALRSLTLGELQPEMVDMRTLVIIGSSLTRRFPRAGGGDWVYTPRWYR